jgi:dimethylargininase
MLLAVTREISASFQNCELIHLARTRIDVERARAQHDAYEWALVEQGCTVRRLDGGADMPDAVFIEDIAVVTRRHAIITRPGAASRRAEMPGVSEALGRYGLPIGEIQDPGTVDGGDVLLVGRDAFIGASSRTNAAGSDQMRRLLTQLAYRVRSVPVHGCLHLKSAVTAVAQGTLLINRDWVSPEAFQGLTLIDVDPDEPQGANALLVGEVVVYPAAFPKTRARLTRHGVRVRTVEVDELAKAEGGVTCCSLVFDW